MHPNYCQITILLVVDHLSSWVYLMMTHPLRVAGNLPIKTLVARRLPTSTLVCHNYILYENTVNIYYSENSGPYAL